MISYSSTIKNRVVRGQMSGADGEWNNDNHIEKAPHRSVTVPMRVKVNLGAMAGIAEDGSDRISQSISTYARGVDPMSSMRVTNLDGTPAKARKTILQNGAFRPPIRTEQDLAPLSRLPRLPTSATTTRSLPTVQIAPNINERAPSRTIRADVLNPWRDPTSFPQRSEQALENKVMRTFKNRIFTELEPAEQIKKLAREDIVLPNLRAPIYASAPNNRVLIFDKAPSNVNPATTQKNIRMPTTIEAASIILPEESIRPQLTQSMAQPINASSGIMPHIQRTQPLEQKLLYNFANPIRPIGKESFKKNIINKPIHPFEKSVVVKSNQPFEKNMVGKSNLFEDIMSNQENFGGPRKSLLNSDLSHYGTNIRRRPLIRVPFGKARA